MRVALSLLFVPATLLLAGCGGHRLTTACSVAQGEGPSERTGEHTLVLRLSGCAAGASPRVEVDGAHGRPLGFAYVPEGGTPGRVVTLDKYRCDIHYADHARRVRLTLRNGTRPSLGLGPMSIIDYCPAEAPSTIVHVYLGGVRPPATWRGVLRDVRDGRLDRIWPCAALRAAEAHFPNGPTYSALPAAIRRAAARACDAALAGLPVKAPRAAFADALGSPDLAGPRCPVWRWPPAGGSVDGARVCFERGRATLVQRAVHG